MWSRPLIWLLLLSAGVGAYPPLFVGRFFDMMRVEGD